MISPALQAESDKLARSWMRHDSDMLREYLVAGVEDPRVNVQSILSRHFLARALTGERFSGLMEQECRFAAAMNWLADLVRKASEEEELALVLYALEHGADNAEGIEIPGFVLQTFTALPLTAGSLTVPNYVASLLSGTRRVAGQTKPHEPSLNTFRDLWKQALAQEAISPSLPRPSVLEPACGSANDYRSLDAYGLAPLVDYTGFDLCAKNVKNARALFPGVTFGIGNVFEIAAADKSFDLCFVHDLFEHLSPEGLQAAVQEVCRVTRRGLCIGFFNMDEIREHQVRPVEEYHWNLLSMARMRESFAACGFAAQAIHIASFLRQQIGCARTHNPNAYTFFLHPA